MFVNPQLHIYYTILAIALYYLIPRSQPKLRRLFLIAISALIVFYAAPAALLACLGISITTAFLGRYMDNANTPTSIKRLIVLSPISVIALFEVLGSDNHILASLGVSYFAIKSISVLIDIGRGQFKSDFWAIFFLNIFFPIFSAGPIEQVKTYVLDQFSQAFNIQIFANGWARIFIGLFKSSYISAVLLDSYIGAKFGTKGLDYASAGGLVIYSYILLKFLSLYVSFSGYTDIAIGTAKVFGLKVRENFNYPIMASSIQNFWQRWHISLSNFISNYLFMPFVRATGKPVLAIFAAFVVAGVWHKVSINYLIWGLLHGTAMGINFWYSRTFCKERPKLKAFHAGIIPTNISRVITLSFVAWVSLFANEPTFSDALQMTKGLIGLG